MGQELRNTSGKTPETLSELFLKFPSRVRLGSPKLYNSRHLKAPEHFQNSLPPSTAGDASFFRSVSGEGLSEPVMEFPAVLGAFLIESSCEVPDKDLHFPNVPCTLRWAKSPIASVQRTRSTLANHSAIPCGTNVKRMDANRAIRIAAQQTRGL